MKKLHWSITLVILMLLTGMIHFFPISYKSLTILFIVVLLIDLIHSTVKNKQVFKMFHFPFWINLTEIAFCLNIIKFDSNADHQLISTIALIILFFTIFNFQFIIIDE